MSTNFEGEDLKDSIAESIGMGVDFSDPENRYNGTREQWEELERIYDDELQKLEFDNEPDPSDVYRAGVEDLMTM